MASVQVNLLFLACAVVCVCLSVPTVAASSHCGYHYLQHYARTIFNATHYTRYYRLKLGYCSPWGTFRYEKNVYTSDGVQIYYSFSFPRSGKRELSVGKLSTFSEPDNRDAGIQIHIPENNIAKRDYKTNDKIKRIQAKDYAEILKDLEEKRSRKALEEADNTNLKAP